MTKKDSLKLAIIKIRELRVKLARKGIIDE